MSRVETLQTTAPRARTPARESSARPERASFSLPEMFAQAATRQVAQRATALVRSGEAPQAPAAGRDAQPMRPESRRGNRDDAARSAASDRTGDARDRREAGRPDRRRAELRETNGPRRPDEEETAGKDATGTEAAAALSEVEQLAAEAVADGAAGMQPQVGPWGPGLLAALGAEPGAAGKLPAAISAPGLAGAGKGPGAHPALMQAGQGEGEAAAGGPEAAESGRTAGVEGAAEPAVAVAALSGRQGGEGGEQGTSGGGAAATPPNLHHLQPGQDGALAKPAFGALLDQAGAATDTRSGAAVQRALVTDVAVGRLPVEIGLRALEGTRSFEIRLSPDELGRVDVKLDIDDDGGVTAHLTVEKPEAMALLTRERSQLERVFEQAGLKPGEGGIAFTLRDGAGENGGRSMSDGGGGDPRHQAGRRAEPEEAPRHIETAIAPPRAILSRLGALDMRI
ncbi:flagellar hook-length control protein FliK [Enterovirga sp. CN4-39]|uniref:flagellar hook-length control protein FliK n=1 Tax=Enterovirga sp. CN4-39 TaxID=3400910 RepID=UPI003C07BA8D